MVSGPVTLSLAASKWCECLSPSYIKFKNDAAGALIFDFPTYTKAVNYTFTPSPAKVIAGTVHLTFSILPLSGSSPTFKPYPESGNASCPAAVRPFIFANGNDWSGEFSRWWSNPESVVLGTGTFSLAVPLTGDHWSSVFGKTGTVAPTEFANALKHVSSLGVTFGGCFFGHGAGTDTGLARWMLSSYTVG